MSECHTLNEALDATYDNIGILSPRDVAAFWAVVPHLLHKPRKSGLEVRGSQRRDGQTQQQQLFQKFDAILVRTLEDIELFCPRDMSTTALGLAKIVKNIGTRRRLSGPHQTLNSLIIGQGAESKEFIFYHIACASVPILNEFEPRHLSNLIYAFSIAECIPKFEDGSTLFGILATEVISALESGWEFNSYDLSNIVWAYATSNEPNPDLFSKVANQIIALDNLDAFSSQDLSNTVWAYATAKESNPKLFLKVANHIASLSNLGNFKPQHLSNTVWAYAAAKESNPNLFKELGKHIVALDNLDGFIPQALSNIAWAYASAEESNPKLFKKLSPAAIEKKDEFISQDISNLLWAFATNGQLDQHLFSSLVPAVTANLAKCDSQGLINIAWAYAVANVDAPSVFDDDFIKACMEKESDFILEDFCQLHQWQLWQEELENNVTLSPTLQEKCYKAFISEAPRPSALQDDVVSELKSIGLHPEEEVLTERGYRLDALVQVNGKKIGIEVDGPSHFLGREPNGSTILKRRQVSKLEGIPLVSVPYWEWYKFKKDSHKKQRYLRSLLGL